MKLRVILLMVALGSWGMASNAEAAGRRGRNWNGMMLSPYGAIPNPSYTGAARGRGRGRNAMTLEARREQQAARMLKAQQRANRASQKGSAAKGGTGKGKGKTAEASSEK